MKLFWKIQMAVFVSFVVMASFISYVITVRQISDAERHLIEKNTVLGDFVAWHMEHGSRDGAWPFESLERLSGGGSFLFWWLVRSDGRIHLADDNALIGDHAGDHLPRVSRLGAEERIYLNREENYGVFLAPIRIGRENWSFWLGFSLKEISKIRKDILTLHLWVCSGSLLLLGGLLFIAIKHFTAPIDDLMAGAEAIGSGELSHRVQPRTEDELGQLAHAFNKMGEELEKTTVSKDYVDSILEAMLDALLVVDRKGEIVTANRAACQMLAFRKEELTGLPAATIFGNERPLEIDPGGLMKLAELEDHETSYRTKDGQAIPVLYSCSIMRQPDGDVSRIVCTARDITKRKEVEEALLRAKEAADAANEAKSELLANMSHEIRTPMNGVMGAIELVLRTNLSARQQELLVLAKTSAGSLLRLLNDIMDFSKIEARRLELDAVAFDLQESLAGMMRSLALRARMKGLDLSYLIHPEVPSVLVGDPGRLNQVIINLVGNAVKFTDRGEIAVRVEIERAGPDGMLLHFSVRDTGMGIPPEKQQIIFESFTQADSSTTRQFGGTGLGLAICARLVELMGGKIWVESEAGKGSTFHFTTRLGMWDGIEPPLMNSGGELNSSDARSAAERVRPLRVLLAEDNQVNRRLAVETLDERGHGVVVAGNGREALALFKKEPFDVVLMDVQMPEMDGFQATKAIRELESGNGSLRRTPIIAMTAHALKGDRERCLAAGMDAYITKPVHPDELIGSVESFGPASDAQRGPGRDALSRSDPGRDGLSTPDTFPAPGSDGALPFDLNAALDRVRGKESLFREIAALFVEQSAELLLEIRAAIDAHDGPKLQRLAHTLKGSAGNFVARDAVDAALKMEELGRGGDIAGAALLIEQLEKEIVRLSRSLSPFMEADPQV